MSNFGKQKISQLYRYYLLPNKVYMSTILNLKHVLVTFLEDCHQHA